MMNFHPKHGPEPRHRYTGEIRPVFNFSTERTANPNEAVCRWDKTPYADKYALEYSADGGLTWNNGTYASGKKQVVTNLPRRQELLLQVRALGSGGMTGPWSDPVTLFVV